MKTQHNPQGMKDEHYHLGLFIFIALSLGIAVGSFIGLLTLQNKIDSMPHWECHNETTTEKIILDWNSFYKDYPIDYNIQCETGVTIHRYELLGTQNLASCSNYDGCPGIGKTCLIEKVEEVCEIK